MNEHVAWLKDELSKAEKELVRKHKKLLAARRESTEAQQEVTSLKSVLARITGETTENAKPVRARAKRTRSSGKRRRATLMDLAADAIHESGPMRINDLLAYVQEHGRNTTRNSLNTSLNSQRPEKFERDSSDKWYLVNEGVEK